MKKRYYAGIGSRETPPKVMDQMTILAEMLEACGFTLRSGNAEGADQAFAAGVKTEAQIWLPWDGFQKEFQLFKPNHDYRVISPSDVEAFKSVEEFHPNARNLSETSCKFMARNYRQVIGLDEPNSEFVIYWTHCGCPIGGTGQALRIASKNKITSVSLADGSSAQQIIDYLSIWHEIN